MSKFLYKIVYIDSKYGTNCVIVKADNDSQALMLVMDNLNDNSRISRITPIASLDDLVVDYDTYNFKGKFPVIKHKVIEEVKDHICPDIGACPYWKTGTVADEELCVRCWVKHIDADLKENSCT